MLFRRLFRPLALYAVTFSFVTFGAAHTEPAAKAPAETIARKHIIAAANPYATAAGREIMREGGSAVDAAIAAQLVLTLVEPESSGIGGGAFMMVYDPKTGDVKSFDGRETAPASATPGMFLDANGKPRQHGDAIPGGLSTGVPGTVAMLQMAHDKYGKLPWAKLFEPAIKLAEDGFPIGPKLAATIASHAAMATKMPDFKRYFFHADGTPLAKGEILKNPQYAATLRVLAKDGAKAFYSGPLAQAIVDAVNNAPVNKTTMTLADLAAYHAVERPAVCGKYRGHRICSMGPPSSGGVAIVQILGMLERFSSKDLAPTTLSGVHLFTQASRLAFADRAMYLADPDAVNVPVAGLVDPLYLAERSKLIDPAKDMGTAKAGTPPEKHAEYAPQRTPQLPGTSHLSVVDDSGMAVSMTMTIESAFGDYMMANGFFLNNELTDFSFEPEHDGKPVANAPAPGKRPLSAMSPALVFGRDGKFWIATGSPGGPLIIDFVTQSLIAMIDAGMKPQETTALPRVVNLNSPTILEKGTSIEALAPQLKAMGHQVVSYDIESGLHIVQKVKGGYIGGADPRRDGNVAGD